MTFCTEVIFNHMTSHINKSVWSCDISPQCKHSSVSYWRWTQCMRSMTTSSRIWGRPARPMTLQNLFWRKDRRSNLHSPHLRHRHRSISNSLSLTHTTYIHTKAATHSLSLPPSFPPSLPPFPPSLPPTFSLSR